MSIVVKKDKNFEFVYIKDVVCYYASVQEPKKKWSPDNSIKDREYSITLFVSDEDREKLEDVIKVNKQLSKVGVDKNKKRVVKYPLSKQVKGDGVSYDDVEGLNGIQITCPEFNKKGEPQVITVVDKDGNETQDLIGNGSRVSVKLFGYRNQDDLLNLRLNIVKVEDLVPYTGGSSDKVVDDELGVSVDKRSPAKKAADEFDEAPDNTSDDSPFDDDDY